MINLFTTFFSKILIHAFIYLLSFNGCKGSHNAKAAQYLKMMKKGGRTNGKATFPILGTGLNGYCLNGLNLKFILFFRSKLRFSKIYF